MVPSRKLSERRAFLTFLAASPLLAYAGFNSRWIEDMLAEPMPQDARSLVSQDAVVIKSVREALSVFDFDVVAKTKLSLAHYTFVTDGSFDNETLLANRDAFKKYQIKQRRLTGITRVDQSIRLLGVNWDSPIYLCPVGRINMFYPQGAVVEARAAKTIRTLMVVAGAQTLADVNAARGEPVWVQAGFANRDAVKRIEDAGCPALVWTVDGVGGGNTIGARSLQRAGVANLNREADERCAVCHGHIAPVHRIGLDTPQDVIGAIGALGGTGVESDTTGDPAINTWEGVKRFRDMTKMKLVVKGIVSREDAELAVQHGVDAIMVSNHAGHVDGAGRGTLDCLPEIVAGVNGKIPIMIDSGFRTGMDVYKALALGATAVGIGRPGMWGLSSFGQEGVETVIELMRRELQVIMAQTDSSTVAKIRRDSLVSNV
jgi:4-hydroxymandelate oxidase